MMESYPSPHLPPSYILPFQCPWCTGACMCARVSVCVSVHVPAHVNSGATESVGVQGRSGLFFFLNFLLLFKYSCLHFPPTTPTSPPSILPPFWLSPCVLYTCSLMTLPLFPPVVSFPLPSVYCQCVLYFNVSGYILFPCLFC